MCLGKYFNIIDIDTVSYIKSEDFIHYLKSHHSTVDTLKRIKTANVEKIIKNYINRTALLSKDGIQYFTAEAVTKYIFSHSEQLRSCQQIVDDIVTQISKTSPTSSHLSERDLYKKLASKLWFFEDNVLLKNVEVRQSDTLQIHYKDLFSDDEWKAVCIFEYQFSKYVNIKTYNYEELLRKKWEFLKLCNDCFSIGESLIGKIEKDIKQNTKRTELADLYNSVYIRGKSKHHALTLDKGILEEINIYFPRRIKEIKVCPTDITEIQVNIELNGEECSIDVSNFCNIIEHYLTNQHNIQSAELNIFKEKTFDNFKYREETSRFEVRDAVILKKLKKNLLFTTVVRSEVTDEGTEDDCNICFPSPESEAL
ncbi:unnamed protein product, partial [Owenia fusiformis]